MRCGGHSLVEAMAAAFLLAAGVMGAVASIALSIRTRHDSALASRAVYLAQALGERMRANTAAGAAGDAANPYLQLDHPSATAGAQPPVSCYGVAQCDPAQLAAFDIQEVAQAIEHEFPGGRIRVCRDALAWDAAAGSLAWACEASPGAPVVVKIGWRAHGDWGAAAVAPRVAMLVPEARP